MAPALQRRCCPDTYPVCSNSCSQIEQNRQCSHDEARQLGQLMRGHVGAGQALDLLELTGKSVDHYYGVEELESTPSLPYGWEKCLDLQTGAVYYRNRMTRTRIPTDPCKGDDADFCWQSARSEKGESCDETVMNDGTLELSLNVAINNFASKVSLQAVTDNNLSRHENAGLPKMQVDTAAANVSSRSNVAGEGQ